MVTERWFEERLFSCVSFWLTSVTLNVVVECAVLVTVLAQQTESVDICKVLKLNQAVHSIPTNTADTLS